MVNKFDCVRNQESKCLLEDGTVTCTSCDYNLWGGACLLKVSIVASFQCMIKAEKTSPNLIVQCCENCVLPSLGIFSN